MAIGVSPIVDYAFKQILGNPEHTGITVHFLNAVLNSEPRITSVQIRNPILDKEFEDDKLSVLDVLAFDDQGRSLNIEIQTTISTGLTRRLTYYACCLYTGQLKEGVHYNELRPAITICVLNQTMFRRIPDLHVEFRLREQRGEVLNDDLQIHFLELPKLRVTSENVYGASAAERWAFFLKNAEQLNRSEISLMFPDKEIDEAAGVLEGISQSPEQRFLYISRLKQKYDQYSLLQEALEEGREQGLERGLAEGRQIGVLTGRIQLLQELLGVSVLSTEELSSWSLDQLTGLEHTLRLQLKFTT